MISPGDMRLVLDVLMDQLGRPVVLWLDSTCGVGLQLVDDGGRPCLTDSGAVMTRLDERGEVDMSAVGAVCAEHGLFLRPDAEVGSMALRWLHDDESLRDAVEEFERACAALLRTSERAEV